MTVVLAECPGRPWGPVVALRSLRPPPHRWLPMGAGSPGSPVRCDIVNTTPSGVRAERPQDVLNYIIVIHIEMLMGCGWIGTAGDGAAGPRVKPEEACSDECGRRVRQPTAAVDEGFRASPGAPRRTPGRDANPRRAPHPLGVSSACRDPGRRPISACRRCVESPARRLVRQCAASAPDARTAGARERPADPSHPTCEREPGGARAQRDGLGLSGTG